MNRKPTTLTQNVCVLCSRKKIKCDIAKKNPCSNCAKTEAQCNPNRKRKIDEVSSSSPAVKRQRSKGERSKGDGKPPPKPRPPPLEATLAAELDAIQTEEGRDLSLQPHFSFDEAMVTPKLEADHPGLPHEDLQLLREEGAFTLPPDTAQHELISTFIEYGHVWTPILDPAWLSGKNTPYLLLQAIFVAASRMTTQANEYGLSSDFYRRAKLLFFFGMERNPLISISTAILLHWYSPVGPGTGPTDTSGFWLRTAESIAFQIGLHKEPSAKDPQRALRRRLWWTLVIRDSIVSSSAGLPRTLNLSNGNVLPPSLDDFTEQDAHARVFPVSVIISQLLGDTVERCQRRELTPDNQRNLENSLFRWVKQDFPCITGPFPGFSFEARQVLVSYLANLIILDRSPNSDGSLSARSLLAASFIAGLYREFLERGELCRLGPTFTFYALCAGLILTPAYKVEGLWNVLNEEIIILKASLQILSKQWGSAMGSIRALHKLGENLSRKQSSGNAIPRLNEEARPFFEGLDTRWCRLWGPIVDYALEQPAAASSFPVQSSQQGSQRSIVASYASTRPFGPPRLPVTFPGSVNDPGGEGGDVGIDWAGSWLLERGSSSPKP
ncbi:hypothetical protein BDW59DRAFT_162572 [Aspergillus cavernicola]|uniref:Zn(2)-C6 fungal-type domain-containing protein n=1 Tax=Aspergillus cavernicola TaxID=176166 RepID=A0ABR4I921_9EURO